MKRWRRNNEELPVHLRRPEVVRPSRPLSVDQWNQFAWESSQASLVPCENCGRTFAPDRLEVHQRSCKTPLPGAPRKLALQQCSHESQTATSRPQSTGPPTIHCHICGRIFATTKSVSIHEPQCLDKWKHKNSKLTPSHITPEPLRPNSESVITTRLATMVTRDNSLGHCVRSFLSTEVMYHYTSPPLVPDGHLRDPNLYNDIPPTHKSVKATHWQSQSNTI
uniref:(California timema) hypothetical protein n=1 Tax=Timema californicum TaxID=61474 RepID=A0A7R9JFM5_TIMCA|nr:unnamed protein product [Timema californicum]